MRDFQTSLRFPTRCILAWLWPPGCLARLCWAWLCLKRVYVAGAQRKARIDTQATNHEQQESNPTKRKCKRTSKKKKNGSRKQGSRSPGKSPERQTGRKPTKSNTKDDTQTHILLNKPLLTHLRSIESHFTQVEVLETGPPNQFQGTKASHNKLRKAKETKFLHLCWQRLEDLVIHNEAKRHPLIRFWHSPPTGPALQAPKD